MKPLHPVKINLRDWQIAAKLAYEQADKTPWLGVACPGAGKTSMALSLAHDLLERDEVGRIVIVAPTNMVKEQWQEEKAPLFGIALSSDEKEPEQADSHGLVTTYAMLANNPQGHRLWTRRAPTLVIFDEIHHLMVTEDEESRVWGDAARLAYGDSATRIIGLSGTPFRTDNNPMPFVNYDEEGWSKADFNYGYADAISDGFCRPVSFPLQGGDATIEINDKLYELTLGKNSNVDDDRRALNTLIRDKEWLMEVIRDADSRLLEIRNTHRDAAGLIICPDINAARPVVDYMQEAINHKPDLVHSNDGQSRVKLKRFKNKGTMARWLVSVNMVSEGVDIPELRVLVYVSNKKTEMYVRQAVGRIVRLQPEIPDDQQAVMYTPKDPDIQKIVETIMEERSHGLRDLERKARDKGLDDGERDPLTIRKVATSHRAEEVIAGAKRYNNDEVVAMRQWLSDHGVDGVSPEKALLIRHADLKMAMKAPDASQDGEPIQYSREIIRSKVAKTVKRMGKKTGIPHNHIHAALNRRCRIGSIKEATAEQLQSQLNLVEASIQSGDTSWI